MKGQESWPWGTEFSIPQLSKSRCQGQAVCLEKGTAGAPPRVESISLGLPSHLSLLPPPSSLSKATC